MLTFTRNDLITTAEKLLDMRPDPVPRFRLVRDLLCLDQADAIYREAEIGIESSKWLTLLQNSQLADGTWGRFHTRDSRLKGPFPTTEIAIAVALDSGLDQFSALLQKTLQTILDYVDGKYIWPDPPEKHDNPLAWNVWVRHYSAAVLALMDRRHGRLEEFWEIWAEAVSAAFGSGTYDRQREIEALNQLLKCRMKNPVPFHTKYPLLILSVADRKLPKRLEDQLLAFVMHSPAGIYYVYDKNISQLPHIHSKGFWGWFQAHKLLSRFPKWRELSEEAANWIWAQRREDGFWDLGNQIARKPYTSFPLSETWKQAENRLIDCSVEMLLLLTRSFDA